jgi:hypothetical protein
MIQQHLIATSAVWKRLREAITKLHHSLASDRPAANHQNDIDPRSKHLPLSSLQQ